MTQRKIMAVILYS